MFQSADSAPSSTVLGAPVIGAIVHQGSPLSPTNWHKISPIRSFSHKERTITAVSIGFHPPYFWTLLWLNSRSSSLWVDLICSELMHDNIRLVLKGSLTFSEIFFTYFLYRLGSCGKIYITLCPIKYKASQWLAADSLVIKPSYQHL